MAGTEITQRITCFLRQIVDGYEKFVLWDDVSEPSYFSVYSELCTFNCFFADRVVMILCDILL